MIDNIEINSEIELLVFLNKISASGIKIPKNLTFEFNSDDLQNYYNNMAKHYLPFPLNSNIERFELMGYKILIKQNTQKTKFNTTNSIVDILEKASTNTAKGFWVKDLKIQGGNNEQQ